MLRQLVLHLKESFVVSKVLKESLLVISKVLKESLVASKVRRQLLQVLLLAVLLLPCTEVDGFCQVVTLDQVDLLLLHLFTFSGVATISHRPVGLFKSMHSFY